jgi:hypothetical protein
MTTLGAPTHRVRNLSEGRRLAGELATIGMVWQRELIRFSRTRTRILSGFVQPILFLFVLGWGLTPLVGSTAGDIAGSRRMPTANPCLIAFRAERETHGCTGQFRRQSHRFQHV